MSFVITPQVRRLLSDADSRYECYTTRLWGYVLSRIVFRGDDWVVSFEQPPTPADGDLRRIDIMCENWDDGSRDFARVLPIEAKHANATGEELLTAEYQGFTAAFAHCEYFRQPRVPVMTCAGKAARLWVYERDSDYLTPWIPAVGDGLGAIDEYISLESPQGHEIIRGLKYIRDNRVPPAHILPSTCSPRPSNVTLPHGWQTIPALAGPSGSLQPTSSYPVSTTTFGLSVNTALQGSDSSVQASTQAASSPPEGPVEVWEHRGRFCFNRSEGGRIETEPRAWEKQNLWQSGSWTDVWVYTGRTSGRRFYTLRLPR